MIAARATEPARSAPPAPAQPAFRVGPANSPEEAEADVIAARVLQGGTLRRRCAACEAEERLSRRADGGSVTPQATESVAQALHEPGQRLAGSDAAFFGSAMAADFSGVTIHTGASADLAARSVGAVAFALGQHVVFARGAYRPSEPEGRRLLAHELAHVTQGAPVLRREEPGAKKKEEDTSGTVIVEGLKTVAKETAKNEKVKEKVIEPVKKAAEKKWEGLRTGEKVAVAGFGAGTYLLGIGAMLGDPSGRKALSDFNLLAPTELIPGWPLTSFSFTLPEAEQGPIGFKAGFDGVRLIDALKPEGSSSVITKLSVDAGWSIDPAGEKSKLTTLKATIGFAPGISITGGLTKGPFLTGPFPIRSPEGDLLTPMQSLPEPPGAKDTRPNVGVVINVDIAKLVPGLFGGKKEDKP